MGSGRSDHVPAACTCVEGSREVGACSSAHVTVARVLGVGSRDVGVVVCNRAHISVISAAHVLSVVYFVSGFTV